MMDVLEKFRERFAAEGDNRVFLKPEIPQKKLANAIQKYAQDVRQEWVGFLVDDSLFGSAKEGIVITGKRIYCCSLGQKSKVADLQYIEEILTHRDCKGKTTSIVLNGDIDLPVSTLHASSRDLIVELLSSLCSPFRSNGDLKVQSKTSGQDDHIYNFTILLPPLEQWLQTVGLSEYAHIFEELKEQGGNRRYEDYTGDFLTKKGVDDPAAMEQIRAAMESRRRDLHDIAQCRVEETVARHFSEIGDEELQGFKELFIVAAKPYMSLGESVAQAITQSCGLKCKCVGVKQFVSSGVSLRHGRRFLLIGDEKENEVVKRELANMEECFNDLGVGIAYNSTYGIVFGEENFNDEVARGVVTASIVLTHIPGVQILGFIGGGWATARNMKKKKICKGVNTRIGLMKFFMEHFHSWVSGGHSTGTC